MPDPGLGLPRTPRPRRRDGLNWPHPHQRAPPSTLHTPKPSPNDRTRASYSSRPPGTVDRGFAVTQPTDVVLGQTWFSVRHEFDCDRLVIAHPDPKDRGSCIVIANEPVRDRACAQRVDPPKHNPEFCF